MRTNVIFPGSPEDQWRVSGCDEKLRVVRIEGETTTLRQEGEKIIERGGRAGQTKKEAERTLPQEANDTNGKVSEWDKNRRRGGLFFARLISRRSVTRGREAQNSFTHAAVGPETKLALRQPLRESISSRLTQTASNSRLRLHACPLQEGEPGYLKLQKIAPCSMLWKVRTGTPHARAATGRRTTLPWVGSHTE